MFARPARTLHVAPAAAPRPATEPPLRGWPLLRLGFRPFYLGGAVFAVLAVPAWIAALLGALRLPTTLNPLLWHGHEMLFGFAAAVIVGFLLTAGKAWTGLPTPRGAALGGLALLWLGARLSAVSGPYAVYAVLDLLLLPVVAAILLTVLLRARNRRNLPLVVILAMLTIANLVFHLAVVGRIPVSPVGALHAGLALIVMIECVIGGRVIPAFTGNATPGLKLRVRPWLEIATLGATAMALLWWVFAPRGLAGALLLSAAALLNVLRQLQWHPQVAARRPILWILHASYAWIAVGLLLLAYAQTGAASDSAGLHALAVGATGGLIIGMITRTARGHTGRPLHASRPEVLAYLLVMAAALVRVAVPLIAPESAATALVIAAAAWSAAFAVYLVRFAPWLVRTRLDGKDG